MAEGDEAVPAQGPAERFFAAIQAHQLFERAVAMHTRNADYMDRFLEMQAMPAGNEFEARLNDYKELARMRMQIHIDVKHHLLAGLPAHIGIMGIQAEIATEAQKRKGFPQ